MSLDRAEVPFLDVPADVHVSQAVECLVGLRLLCLPKVKCRALDVGCEWFERVQGMAPTELNRQLGRFRSFGHAATLWLELIGLAAEGPATLPELLVQLEDMSPGDIW